MYNIFARAFGLEETDSVFGSIKNAIMTVVNKITGFFGTVKDAMIDFADEFGLSFNLIDIIYAPVNVTINAIKKMFSIDRP